MLLYNHPIFVLDLYQNERIFTQTGMILGRIVEAAADTGKTPGFLKLVTNCCSRISTIINRIPDQHDGIPGMSAEMVPFSFVMLLVILDKSHQGFFLLIGTGQEIGDNYLAGRELNTFS